MFSLPNTNQSHLRKIVTRVYGFAIMGNGVFVVGSLIEGLTPLIIISSVMAILLPVALYISRKTTVEFGLHALIILVTLGYLIASFTELIQFSLILSFPSLLGFALLVFSKFKTRFLYLILMIICSFTYIINVGIVQGETSASFYIIDFTTCLGFLISLYSLFEWNVAVVKKFRNQQEKDRLLLKKVFDYSLEGIICRDFETKKVISCNQKALEILGVKDMKDLAQVKPKDLYDIGEELTDEEFYKRWLTSYQNNVINDKLVTMNALDGKQKRIKLSSTIDNSSNELSTITFMKDVTAETQAQEDLENKNRELEKYIESNIQLEHFAHISSHDLMAPVNTIKNYVKLLKTKAKKKLEPQELLFCEIIYNNSVDACNLVEDLLEYSKVDAQKLNTSNINTQTILTEVQQNFKLQLEKQNIGFQVSEDLPAIIADQVKFKRIFQNLISNAIKFIDTNKDKSFIKVSFAEEKDAWRFYIEDNGIGMPETDVDIFQTYTRLNRKDIYNGSGMGLSFCKRIVEQHHGTINYQSKLGEGSKFTFTIAKNLDRKINKEHHINTILK